MESKRTQAGRTAATRAALVAAGRRLFAERGFADVGTDELARAAGVTRGALYHQFGGKEELFAAVFEQVEEELTAGIAARFDADEHDPRAMLRDGVDAWLEASAEPEVSRLVLVEAPAALGYDRWREIGHRHALGLVEGVLEGAMRLGAVVDQPVRPVAHVLIGALEEAGLYAARADDPVAATAEVRVVLMRLVDGLLVVPD